jgi:hypothetical protein
MKSPGASVSDTIAVPQLLQACGPVIPPPGEFELIPTPDPPQAVSAHTPINTNIRCIRNTALFMALLLDLYLLRHAPSGLIFRLKIARAKCRLPPTLT